MWSDFARKQKTLCLPTTTYTLTITIPRMKPPRDCRIDASWRSSGKDRPRQKTAAKSTIFVRGKECGNHRCHASIEPHTVKGQDQV